MNDTSVSNTNHSNSLLNIRAQFRALQAKRQQCELEYRLTGEPEKSAFPGDIKLDIRSSMDELKKGGLSLVVQQLVNKDRSYAYHEVAAIARKLAQLSAVKLWAVRTYRGQDDSSYGLVIVGQYKAAQPAIVFEFSTKQGGFTAKSFHFNYHCSSSSVVH